MKLLKIAFLTFVLTLLTLALLAAFIKPEIAVRTADYKLRIEELADGLDHPWSLAFLPSGRMLISERSGRLWLFAEAEQKKIEVFGLPPIAVQGQGGLLDVVLHPDFERNRLIYFSYSGKGPEGIGTEVARARLAGRQLEDLQVVFRMEPKSDSGRHFGSRMVFDRDGFLYITLGDRGDRPRAQRPDDHAGSVIRLHDDGRIPEDNPFVGHDGWKAEKFTLGQRNIQGAALHPQTGELWTHEHGPQGGDEINIIHAGVNYGWPVITYGVNYGIGTKIGEGTHKEGMAQPLHVWVPSIAPSGMMFYTGDKFPEWQGNLFLGALKDRMLVRLELNGEKIIREERFLKDTVGRIRDVRQGPDGFIYLLTDHEDGKLIRLKPVKN
ncbi:MAG: PQQ-dependent sugar dehydrogenase [Desulfuromonadales bacterium]|nr:PQQ-dependent sugar dehydrogenase [Desulfuromonadales bacterium]MBN2792135.1 PQQ-dependent sugar dehydrogenase [Desulfuromonadales bacterium]